MALLPIKYNDELFDFEKEGVQYNWKYGIISVPTVKVLTWDFRIYSANNPITKLDLIRITIRDRYYTVEETTDISALVTIDRIADGDYVWYYCNSQDSRLTTENGIYYLLISDGYFFLKSEIFYINNDLSVSIYLVNNAAEYLLNNAS
jgi:hypothetical protein